MHRIDTYFQVIKFKMLKSSSMSNLIRAFKDGFNQIVFEVHTR